MKFKVRVFSLCVLCVLLSSCFNGLKTPKETSVSFYMDEATVSKILRSNSSSRSAADSLDTSDYYLDVTLCGDNGQSATVPLDSDVHVDFANILVGSRIYAKAQIYKYEDSEKTSKNVIYRGESPKIIVSEGVNVLSIRLGSAQLLVSFEPNGGTAVASQTVATGTPAAEPESPVKPENKKRYSGENYAFEGWYKDEALTQAYNFALPVTDDLTLYAKWLQNFVFVPGATVNNYLAEGRSVKVFDLFVSDHEVTQAEYQAVTGKNPSNNKFSEELPVENVTWFEAIEYCNQLSLLEGLTPCYKIEGSTIKLSLAANGYRLPTEAEWEYVATKAYRYNVNFDRFVLYYDNSNGSIQKENNRLVDELELRNLLGNVAEWCYDVYSSSVPKAAGPTGPMAVSGTTENRVVRGGSYQSYSSECTPSARSSADPSQKSPAIGFRVVRTAINEFKIIKNKVQFETNGGTQINTQSIVFGDTAEQPADPVRTGYFFNGWKYADQSFDFDTPITQDVVIQADWTPIKYKVIFNKGASSAGGTMDVPQEFTYDVEKPLTENQFTEPTGYRFGGWSLEPHTDVPATIEKKYSDKQSVKNLTAEDGAVINLYALWIEKASGTIVYVLSDYDVSTLEPSTYLPSANVTLPVYDGTILKIPGYEFGGWYEDPGYNSVTLITGWNAGQKEGEVKVYGKWNPSTDTPYTVKHYKQPLNVTDLSSYEIVSADTQTLYGTTEQNTNASAKTYTGFTARTIDQTTITSDGLAVVKVYYDRNTHTVTYADGVDDEVIDVPEDSTSYQYESQVTIDYTISRQGWNFAGWSDGTNTYTSGTDTTLTMGDSDIVLTAQWTASTATYTVKHYFQPDTGSTDLDDYEENTALVEHPSGTSGQLTSAAAKTIAGFTNQTITQQTIKGNNSTEVIVYYDRVKHTVTYDDGVDDETLEVPAANQYCYGQNVDVDFATTVSRQGYNFAGWSDGTTTYVSTGPKSFEMGISDVTLTAQWTPGTATYEVQHYFQNVSDSDYTINSSMTQAKSGTTGTNTTAAAQTVEGFDTPTVTQQPIAANNSTIIKIYYDRKEITYTFELQTGESFTNGSSETGTRTGRYGATFTTPLIQKAGYTLNSSAWDMVGGGTITTLTFGSSNATLHAKWTAINYTITFHLNGGSVYGNTSYSTTFNAVDDTDVPLDDFEPSREHFTFAGYYSNEGLTANAHDIDTTNASDLKDWDLYAKWNYTITFNTNGGSTISPMNKDHTQTATAPTAPTKDDYVFGGWYSDSTLTTSYSFEDSATTGTVTLYAKWNYTVTYKNSVTNTVIDTVTYGDTEATTRPATDPTYTGYKFDDYYNSNTLVNKFTFGTVCSGNQTVYARFFNTMYVEDDITGDGDADNEGTREIAPVDSIATAVSKIIDYNQSDVNWIIYISGQLDGTQKVESTLTTAHAASLTIQGMSGDNTVDIINANIGATAQAGGTALSISTAVPVTIKNLQITGGNTTTNAGGVNVARSSNVTFDTGTLITGNKAAQNGGGVYVYADSTSLGKLTILSGAVISNNESKYESTSNSYGGGGIYNKGIVSMNGGQISGNSAYYCGGGVYNDGSNTLAKFYMSGDAYIGHRPGNTTDFAVLDAYEGMGHSNYVTHSNGMGGGVYNNDAIFKLGVSYNMTTDTEVTTNLITGIYYNYAYQGGGIFNKAAYRTESKVEMKSGSISNNGAFFGGGIYNNASGTATYPSVFDMQGGEISNNKVHRNGASGAVRGGGVLISYYNNGNSLFYMSGNAYVPKGESNYICIDADYESLYITIKDALTNPDTEKMMIELAADSSYAAGKQVLYKDTSVSSSDFIDAISRFEINKSGFTINNSGQLQTN